MNKATFLKKIKEYSLSDGRYSKLNAIKFMRDITRESGVGLKECKEMFDLVCLSNELLEVKHFELIYKKMSNYVRNYQKGILVTTEVKHLYKCSGCAISISNGEVVKGVCTRQGGCYGELIGSVTTVTTVRRFNKISEENK